MLAAWIIQRSAGYLLFLHILALLCRVNVALQFKHGSATAYVSQAAATYPVTQVHPTLLGKDSPDYWKRDRDFCWPLIDPGAATQIFCQCSDYVIRPIKSQAPTPGMGYEPCAAYSGTATTISSKVATSSTSSTRKSSSTSVRASTTVKGSKLLTTSTSSTRKRSSTSVRSSTTTSSSKSVTISTSSTRRSSSTSVRSSTTTSSSKLVTSSTSSTRRTSSTSTSGPSKPSSHVSSTIPTSKASSSSRSGSFIRLSASPSTKSLPVVPQPFLASTSSIPKLTRNATEETQSPSQLPLGRPSINLQGLINNPSSLSSLKTISISIDTSSILSVSSGVIILGNKSHLTNSPLSNAVTPNSTLSQPHPQLSSITSLPPIAISGSPMQASKSSPKRTSACPSPTSTLPIAGNDPAVFNRRAPESNCDGQGGGAIKNTASAMNVTSSPAIAPLSAHDPDINGTYTLANATSDLQSQCQDFGIHQLQACWEVLNVTGFIYDWMAFNQHTCDEKSMGFADCFLNIETQAGVNCSDFTALSQCLTPDAQRYKGRKHAAQRYYVAFNIWNIQNWFHTYWEALTGANGLTADNIAAVCRLVNVPQPKSFPWNELLSVMAFALGLISPSGWGSKLPAMGSGLRNVFTKTQVPGEYLLRAVQGSPTMTRNLLASGELSKTDVQIGAISSNLASIVSQLETNIQNAIVNAMSNLSLFMEFASEGFFSTQIQNINTIQQNLTQALNTYVVSQAFQDDSVIITRALDTDVHALATNGTELPYDLGCSHGYDEWGMCNVWWYDAENNISYGLESWKDMSLNFTSVLHDLFNTNVTTPEMLFQGSQVCANAAGGTQGSAPGSNLTTKTGIWNAECIANMKICTWELGVLSQEKEYTDCPGETQFALQGCGDGTDNEAMMPVSYLGKWLFGEYEGIVCNQGKKGSEQPE